MYIHARELCWILYYSWSSNKLDVLVMTIAAIALCLMCETVSALVAAAADVAQCIQRFLVMLAETPCTCTSVKLSMGCSGSEKNQRFTNSRFFAKPPQLREKEFNVHGDSANLTGLWFPPCDVQYPIHL